jgi:hypothetical protein
MSGQQEGPQNGAQIIEAVARWADRLSSRKQGSPDVPPPPAASCGPAFVSAHALQDGGCEGEAFTLPERIFLLAKLLFVCITLHPVGLHLG